MANVPSVDGLRRALREFSTATHDGDLVIQAHPDPVVVYPAKDFWLLVVESERGHLRRFTKHSEFQDDDELSAWVLATLEELGITPRRLDWGDEFQDAWVALDEFEARLERTDWLGHPAINQILNDAAREIRDHLRRPVTQGARERIPHVLVEAEAKVTEAQSAHEQEAARLREAKMRRPPRPDPRYISHWSDAERLAAEWVTWFGFGSAAVTQATRDGGIDVVAERALAQVKDYGKATPAGPVRELYAIAHVESKIPIFFARSGFTSDAVAWATRAGMALFSFDLQGEPSPHTPEAEKLLQL